VATVIAAAHAGRSIAVWASREPNALAEAVRHGDGKLIRIEDGFIRSPGLGAHFCPAYSLIFDGIGIYYDAIKPSDLEVLQTNHPFDDALKSRARRLRDRLIASAISKYAVRRGEAPSSPVGRERIMVVGQVEDDASIRLSGAAIRTNLALLEEVRADHPNAWIA
jgi:capsular polysaccharide export protein